MILLLQGGIVMEVDRHTQRIKAMTILYQINLYKKAKLDYDIDKLMQMLQKLADSGNTILIIEHNMDIIKCADWIIDLGPDGGDCGGEVIFEGTPEQIIKNKKSYTGKYLKPYLEK